jgi:hypothetical protein
MRPKPGSDYDPDNAWSQDTAIALWHGNSHHYVVDNTIHNTYDDINAIYSGEVEISGNIISQIDNAEDNHYFSLEHPARYDLVTIDHNLFVDDGDESYFNWWNNSGHSNSLSVIQTVSGGLCAHCQAISHSDSSEVFTNLSTGFELSQDSLAAGKNVKHPVYDLFMQHYGENIYVDFNGKSRPLTAPPIGAFEIKTALLPPSPPVLK